MIDLALGNTDVTHLPYADRQLVVVAEDAIVAAARQAEIESLTKQNSVDWGKIASVAIGLTLGGTGSLAVELGRAAVDAWGRARASGLRILQVSKTEAAQLLFPPGHPRDGVLYIAHPAKAGLYYAAADFHRVAFEHKVAEAMELLMSLGATRVTVRHVKGWSREFAASLSVPLAPAGDAVSAGAKVTANEGRVILFEARLKGTTAPRLPGNLVWLPHEPTWQTIARGRLEYGLKDFSLSIIYQDDFGVHAGLKASVLKTGLDLGGKFEDHVATIWHMEGEFADAGTGA